jgi:hypothetical protein
MINTSIEIDGLRSDFLSKNDIIFNQLDYHAYTNQTTFTHIFLDDKDDKNSI